MQCPKCNFQNSGEMQFCGKCGSKLAIFCNRCGFENPEEFNFCGKCGNPMQQVLDTSKIDYKEPKVYTPKHLADKILTTRSSIEGERKLVTVLFADVANYTSISERLDPEEVHQIMDGCFNILMAEIHKFEGTINQFTGDGVMALFGAPVSHEGHAQRACLAAISIQNALEKYSKELKLRFDIQFKMRVGINSGLVVVGSIGDDLRMDYTAVGNTTNLASRMETSAEAGTILLSEKTKKIVADYFELKSIGEIQIKGKEQGQRAYQLIKTGDIETRIGASQAKGFTRFVGRKNSISTLVNSFEKAKKGSGQIVGIVGEAGVGKSRLLLEMKNIFSEDDFEYLEGRCLQYGGSILYLPILDILKSVFEINDDDKETVIKKKINDIVTNFNDQFKSLNAPFQDILSLKIDDKEYTKLQSKNKREKIFDAIRDFLIWIAQDKPLVLAVEDLHWIDKTSEEFLNYFIGWLPNTQILLILLYRPEYTHQWGSKSYYTKIGVDQLGMSSSGELVKAILEEGEVSTKLNELILKRSAGNPLFMEEFTRTLIENGSIGKQENKYVLKGDTKDIQIPDTIQGIIAARLDRLEDNLKRTMQVASVIGRDFAFKILQSITGMRLELKSYLLNLQGLEFIYEKRLFPELEYIFKHALTQEVAYNSLLQKSRKELHEKIGMAIEDLYPERLEEFYEMIAYHYTRSENKSKACQYLKWSGGKAIKNHSLQEAFSYYKEAVSVAKSLPNSKENKEQQLEVLQLITIPMTLLGYPDESLQLIEEGESLSSQLSNHKARVTFHSKMGHYHFIHGNPEVGIKYGEECFRDSEEMQDVELMIATGNELCGSYTSTGRHLGVIDVAPRIINMIERTQRQEEFFGRSFNPYVDVHGYYGMSMALTGKFKEAMKLCDKGLKFALRINHLPSLGYMEVSYGYVYLLFGDGYSAIDHGQKALKYSEDGQVVLTTGLAWILLGLGHFLTGDIESAEETIGKGFQLHREAGMSFFLAQNHRVFGAVLLDIGDFKNARINAQKALKLSLKNHELEVEGLSRILLGQVIGKTEQLKFLEARHSIMEGIDILEKLKLRPQYAIGYLSLCKLYAENGYKEEAIENLKKAEGLFQEMGMEYWLVKVQEVLVSL